MHTHDPAPQRGGKVGQLNLKIIFLSFHSL